MRSLLLAVAAPLLTTSAPALSPSDQADLRCYLAYDLMASSSSKDTQLMGTVGEYYFQGRLDGRTPDLDLESAIKSPQVTMDLKQINSILAGCQRLFDNRRERIAKIVKRVSLSE